MHIVVSHRITELIVYPGCAIAISIQKVTTAEILMVTNMDPGAILLITSVIKSRDIV